MDAKLYGFRLGKTSNCTLADLARYFQAISGQQFSFVERERRLFAGMKDDKCVGVLLTLKEQRRFPELDGGTLKVFIHEAASGRSPFDFNFFAFDPNTGGGVYQHYHGSCSIHRFGYLSRLLYDDIARNNCTGDAETLLSRSSNHRLRSDLLDFSVVLMRETFEEQIAKLDRVTVFEYDIVSQKDMSKDTSPFHPFARLERRTIRFNAEVSGKSILPGVTALLPKAIRNRMFRVIGNDEEGDEHKIAYLAPPPDELAKSHVDALADEVVLTFNDITQSTYVDTMLQVLDDNPALLGPEEGA